MTEFSEFEKKLAVKIANFILFAFVVSSLYIVFGFEKTVIAVLPVLLLNAISIFD